ncbi:MAG: Do family serine endopeptidase [Bacteroidaceae bacterium]|nr:Do family serine endopeptidase [Bacteroidaceae bacterium]
MKKVFKKLFFGTVVIATSSIVAGYTAYKISNHNMVAMSDEPVAESFITKAAMPVQPDGLQRIDLTDAADKSVHAVVHIKSTEKGKTAVIRRAPDIYDFFFGDGTGRQQRVQTQPRVGFGSGVILSDDGYIVTNNHVIDGADEIMVTLNDNRTFPARLIGADANTDLALVKIEADDKLPFLTVGDSDNLKIGEWVLAVGNPFNLTSTVTAGIVSAKARSLGIYNGGIESFIQTDAAINQGNSGGALVNANGELVGINAVLSSPTGSYAGYGFAIPTSIMTKVVSDLKEFGTVQRAVLGIVGGTVTAELNEKENLGTVDGVYVSDLTEGGAAKSAGIEKGDVIIKFNEKPIKTMAELQEALAKTVPGTEVKVTVLRDKKEKTFDVTLVNVQGNTNVVKNVDLDILGAEFKPINDKEKQFFKISYGLKVTALENGLFSKYGVKKGIVIQKVNGTAMRTIEDLQKVVKQANSSTEPVLFISGYNATGQRVFYSVPLQ